MAAESSKKDKKKSKLPEHLETQRTHVIIGPDQNKHVNTITSANAYMAAGVDNRWDFEQFKAGFDIVVHRLDEQVMEVDLVGIDPSVANALRRILIAEVPTVAIEHVFMVNNTSIIQDEVFAHRLGMVPIAVDPRLFEARGAEDPPSERNTIVFKLDVTCTARPGGIVDNDKILSSQLVWLPEGSQMPEETSCRFSSHQATALPALANAAAAPRPVHDDILLAKLRPGQCIQLEAHCCKGSGRDHAKWSPVSTAWYRLHPELVLLSKDLPLSDPRAAALLAAAPGLFVKDGSGRYLAATTARGHEQHWEKLRRLLEDESYASVYQLLKRKDHFIFTIESTGILPPDVLFTQALQILATKCDKLIGRL